MYHYGFALPALRDTGTTFKTCGWQTLLHNRRQDDASTRLSHQAVRADSVKAASAWRECGSLVWFCGCVCLKEQRRVGSDISTKPPPPPSLCCGYPGPLSSLLLSPITEISEKTAGVSCYNANSPCSPLKTQGSQLRGMREAKKSLS